MYELLGVTAGLVGIAAYVPYTRDILAGRAQPERASWLIWLIEYGALFAAQAAKGATHSLWLVGLQVVGVALIFGLSLRYGVGEFDRSRKLLIAAVCATLVVWYVMGSASSAIVLLLLIEALGVAFTLSKVYRQPDSETVLPWFMIGCAGLLAIPSVGLGKDAVLYLYPAVLAIINFAVVGTIWLGRRKMLAVVPVRVED